MNQGYEFKRISIRDIQVVGKRIVISRVNATDVTYTLKQAEEVIELWKTMPRSGLQGANLDKFKACIQELKAQPKGGKQQALSQKAENLVENFAETLSDHCWQDSKGTDKAEIQKAAENYEASKKALCDYIAELENNGSFQTQ